MFFKTVCQEGENSLAAADEGWSRRISLISLNFINLIKILIPKNSNIDLLFWIPGHTYYFQKHASTIYLSLAIGIMSVKELKSIALSLERENLYKII